MRGTGTRRKKHCKSLKSGAGIRKNRNKKRCCKLKRLQQKQMRGMGRRKKMSKKSRKNHRIKRRRQQTSINRRTKFDLLSL
jgi:hypothetical protein